MASIKLPNILITGTPGTGKTSLAENITQILPYTRVDVTEVTSFFLFLCLFINF